jgi:hypothetical protein
VNTDIFTPPPATTDAANKTKTKHHDKKRVKAGAETDALSAQFLKVAKAMREGMSETEVAAEFHYNAMENIPNSKALDEQAICGYLGGGSLGCAAPGSGINMPLVSHYKAYAIPLKDVRETATLTTKKGGGAIVRNNGCDLTFVSIFDDGKLLKSFVQGTRIIHGERLETIWSLVGSLGGAQANAQARKTL